MNRFDQALYQTVQYHQSLCYGIIDQTADKEAHFLRLPEIHRDDITEFWGQSSEDKTDDEDTILTGLLEKFHVRRLFEGHRKPAWRIVVFKHGGQWGSNALQSPSRQKVTLAFLANHALADGLSHSNFFQTFFRFFNNAPTEQARWPFAVAADFRAAVPLEETVDLQARDESIVSSIDPSANIWSGANMFLNSIEDYGTGVRLVTIPQAPLSNALQLCKKHKISLTGLLNSLLLIYLSKATPTGHGFRSIIPYSMRHVTNASQDEILNHASGHVCEYPESLVSELRNSTENSSEELQLIVKLGLQCRRNLAAELARCPKNNVLAGMIGVDDWYGSSKSQLGQKRAITFGISNLGSVPVESSDAPLKLEKMIISQYVFPRALHSSFDM
jgi:hypothetical protein